MPKARPCRRTWGEAGSRQGQLRGHRERTGSPVPAVGGLGGRPRERLLAALSIGEGRGCYRFPFK